MKEISVSNEIIDIAREKAKELGNVRKSITAGGGNVAGFIGEHLAQSVYGGEMINTFKYDLVLPDGRRIDVKTKRSTVVPQEHYDCTVTDFQIDYDCDGYIFVRVLPTYEKGWVLGHISKDDFKKKSIFKKRGERDGKFTYKHSCYNVKIDDLVSP